MNKQRRNLRNLFLATVVAAALVITTACPTPTGSSGGGGDDSGNVSAYEVTADSASITPTSVSWGETIKITVDNPRTSPSDGNITAVTADLSSLGGLLSAELTDDGSGGDTAAGDGTYTLSYTVPGTVMAGGSYTPSVSVEATAADGTTDLAPFTADLDPVTVSAVNYTVNEDASGALTSIAGNSGAASHYLTLGDSTVEVTLPFEVTFYGRAYAQGSTVEVSLLGGLSFAGFGGSDPFFESPATNGGGNDYTLEAGPGVAPHHNDTFTRISTEGTIWTETIGASSPTREFVIEWHVSVPLDPDYRFQVRFYEDTAGQDFSVSYSAMPAEVDYSDGAPVWALSAFSDSSGAHFTPRSETSFPPAGTHWDFTWPN